jgi:hypothetical protein
MANIGITPIHHIFDRYQQRMKQALALLALICSQVIVVAQNRECHQYTDEKIADFWETHFKHDDPERTDSLKTFYFLDDLPKVEQLALWAKGHGFQFKKGKTTGHITESTTLPPHYVVVSRELAGWGRTEFEADIRSLRELLSRLDPEWCGRGGFGYKP